MPVHTPPVASGLTITIDGAVGRITLDRPDKLNALDRATLEGLAAAARWFDTREEIKVVVVAGAGRGFSAGFDLTDPTWRELGPPARSAVTGRAMAEAIAGMRAVTIAAVHGHCIGGGVVLAAACDLRLAATTARFAIPEVDLGIPLYWTGIPLLARELGPSRTKELVLTGRPFDAVEADRLGFVTQVVPDDELAAAVDALAGTIAAKSALVVRTTKAQVDAVVPPVPGDDPGAEADVAAMAAAFADPESRAVARAYLQRTMGRGGSS